MTRVLVTGGSGFVGSAVLTALAALDVEVIAISSKDIDLLRDDPAEVCRSAGASHLLHLAWCARPGFWTSPENDLWVNATTRLIERFAETGGRRVVLAGTGAEYAPTDQSCDERSTPIAPRTPYGVAKARSSAWLAENAPRLGLTHAHGRLFQLYGPGEDAGRLIPTVTNALLRGEPVSCTPGTQCRDFIHVADAGDALAALTLSNVDGAVNIGTGRGTRIAEVVTRVAELVGGLELVRFDRAQTDDEPAVVVAGLARSSGELGWRAAIDLEHGLASTVEWWRALRR